MSTKGKSHTQKKIRPKQARVKTDHNKSKYSEKRAVGTFHMGQKSARRGGTTVIFVAGRSGKYKVYGGKGGRVPSIGSKATASGIARRLGVKAKMFREVDRLIEHLRLRKKIG